MGRWAVRGDRRDGGGGLMNEMEEIEEMEVIRRLGSS